MAGVAVAGVAVVGTKLAVVPAIKALQLIVATTAGGAGRVSEWAVVAEQFDRLTASTDALLHHSLLGECLGIKDGSFKEISKDLLRMLEQKYHMVGQSMKKDLLKEIWQKLSDDSFDSRLEILFSTVDKDGDGKVTKEDIKQIISLSASATKFAKIQERAEEYATFIMDELDPSNVGHIKLQDLETLLSHAPKEYGNTQDTGIIRKMLSQNLKPTVDPQKMRLKRLHSKCENFLTRNLQGILVLVLWLGIVFGLFLYKFVEYTHKEAMKVTVSIAKGVTETIKFNMALILLLFCTRTINWIKIKTKLDFILPLDSDSRFHKVIAIGIAVAIVLHVFLFFIEFVRVVYLDDGEYEELKPFYGVTLPKNLWWFLKGVNGITGIVMVVITLIGYTQAIFHSKLDKIKFLSPNFFKKLSCFGFFWRSHHFLLVIYPLLIVHGIYLYHVKKWYQKTTWMYLALPITLYAIEIFMRIYLSETLSMKILQVYPGNVLALHMSKPDGFNYKSGQYMLLNSPVVSPFKWHRVSLTSAPVDDHLSFYIPAMDSWSQKLRTLLDEEVSQASLSAKSTLLQVDYTESEKNASLPKMKLDGPYGTPVIAIGKFDVVLLVGLGFHARPLISIARDIIHQTKKTEGITKSGKCASSTREIDIEKNGNVLNTRKSYIHWVSKEQGSFEWIKLVMDELVGRNEHDVIQLHNHCTGAYEGRDDSKSALVSMIQYLHQAKNSIDSDSAAKSYFAKPNWSQICNNIAHEHPNTRVGFFYMGTWSLKSELKIIAHKISKQTSTKFEFHG